MPAIYWVLQKLVSDLPHYESAVFDTHNGYNYATKLKSSSLRFEPLHKSLGWRSNKATKHS